ncbi:MAG TPA: EamA family transporter [Bryobacteraceae bacterium]|nr:EamA family transporter [Bryobacteraceae bacterium]
MTRAWLLLAVIVGCTVMSDLLTSFEMKRHGEIEDFAPSPLGRTLHAMARKKYLILAIVFMAISFFTFVTLVQTADLSFAVPASALNIVVETILARTILKERVDSRRWWGVCLVAFGVGMLAQ